MSNGRKVSFIPDKQTYFNEGITFSWLFGLCYHDERLLISEFFTMGCFLDKRSSTFMVVYYKQ